MEFKKYGKIGTDQVVSIQENLVSTLESDYVELKESKPTDDRTYVITRYGTWGTLEAGHSKEDIQAKRKERILKEWPIDKQMEAIMDANNGDISGIKKFNEFHEQLRKDLPYVS